MFLFDHQVLLTEIITAGTICLDAAANMYKCAVYYQMFCDITDR